MGFVPLTGPATLHAGAVPRESSVEFTDAVAGRRVVTLPIRAALPVLAKARVAEEAHPSVALLAAASLFGMRLVAAGKFAPGEGAWRPADLGRDDTDRLRLLASSRAYAGVPADAAEAVVRRVVEAVVDTMPRSTPAPVRARPTEQAFAGRLREVLARHSGQQDDLPQLVTLSLRVEADEEELVGGA